MSFDALGLSPALLRAVAEFGYSEPTQIQREAITLALTGRDVLAAAPEGSGKTAAYLLPLLERLFPAGERLLDGTCIHAVILARTIEAAGLVFEKLDACGRELGLVAALIGDAAPSLRDAGADIVVATPSRLAELLDSASLDLSGLRLFVLDDADQVIAANALPELERILTRLPRARQTLLFSSVLSDDVRRLAKSYLVLPVELQVRLQAGAVAKPLPPIPTSVALRTFVVIPSRKRDALQHLIAQDVERQTLVFCRTKHGADKIAHYLERWGHSAAAYHGAKSHGARARALSGFQSGELKILVATDSAARGLDLPKLPVVMNYDLPYAAEDFIYRIARTGGDGDGLAITLVTQDDTPQYRDVQQLLGGKLDPQPLEGFEPAEPFDPSKDPPPREAREHAPREPREQAPREPRAVAQPDVQGMERADDSRGRKRRRRRGGDRPIKPEFIGLPVDDEGEELGDAPQPAIESESPDRGPRGERRRQRKRGPRDPNVISPQGNDVIADDDGDNDRPDRGNSIHTPPLPQYPQVIIRRRGRKDPFAPVVLDENRANQFDERQPEDFRDQWSVLGPDASRPAWTFADHRQPTGERRGPGPRGTRPATPVLREGAPRGRRRQRTRGV